MSPSTTVATRPAPIARHRRSGVRMSCVSCEVAWTGPATSSCWVCDGPGLTGAVPSIYPDVD